jgi:cholesterol oxidase
MCGWVSTSVLDDGDYTRAARDGEAKGARLEFNIMIEVDDLDYFLAEPGHHAHISGTVEAPAIPPASLPRRLAVTSGTFTLLQPWPDEVETWHMIYQMNLRADDGTEYKLDGFKVLRERSTFEFASDWADTSTLYTAIRNVSDDVVAQGVLRLSPGDFVRLLATMRATRARNPLEAIAGLARFARLFLGSLARLYGGPLDPAAAFPPDPKNRVPLRELRLPTPERLWFRFADGWIPEPSGMNDEFLRLTHYPAERDENKGPVVVTHGFGMSTLAYITDTIETNFAEFLHSAGYDVWLFDYRASPDLPSVRSDFTIDDVAQVDWPLAVQEVRRQTNRDVQVVAHCVGSMSFQMAMLRGMSGVRAAVCSQVTVHPVSARLNRIKARLPLGPLLQDLGMRTIHPDLKPTLGDKILDTFLRLVPVPPGERCGSAVCRWIFAFYGPTHRHAQLNQATHDDMARLFGVADVTALEHISLMARRTIAVDHLGNDIYLKSPGNLTIPVLFLAGRYNRIFLPATSKRTLEWLRDNNGRRQYARIVLDDYAHLDGFVGKHADKEVWPDIIEFLDAHP